MRKAGKRFISILMSLTFASTVALGQDASAPASPSEGSRPVTPPANAAPNTSYNSGGLSGPVPVIERSSGQNAWDQSKAAQDKQKEGKGKADMFQMIALAFAAAMTPGCANPKTAAKFCPLMIAGLVAGMMAGNTSGKMGKAAGQSGTTMAAVQGQNTGSVDQHDSGTDTANAPVQKAISRIPGAKADLRAGTLEFKGKTYSADDFKDDASMAAAGFSASDIAGIKGAFKKMGDDLKKAQTTAGSDVSDGFGDSIALGGAKGSSGPGYGDVGSGADGAAKAKEKVDVSNLKKDFNGTPIGVAQANLFTLVHNRYGVVVTRNDVLVPGAASSVPAAIAAPTAPAAPRAPASGH